MSLKKENAISEIMQDFEKFSNIVLSQLNILENIINTGETTILDDVYTKIISNENEMDKYEVKLSQDIIKVISLYKPVASELRQIIACYRMSFNLERIGDLTYNIANFIRNFKNQELYSKFSDAIGNMLNFTINMVQKSILSFTNADIEDAIWTIKNDEVVNEINHTLLEKVIKKSNFKTNIKEIMLDFLSMKTIVSNIERIADNATHIAEASIYALEGTDIRHKKIKKLVSRFSQTTEIVK